MNCRCLDGNSNWDNDATRAVCDSEEMNYGNAEILVSNDGHNTLTVSV